MEKPTLKDFRVLVCIVNYRSSQLVRDLLPTLIQQLDLESDYIVIVDNDSCDNSINEINYDIEKNNWNSYITLFPSQRNGGFSYGNNLAINIALKQLKAEPDYVWLLNPDTQLLPDALENLLIFLEDNPAAGVLGSCLVDENNAPQGSAFRFHTLKSEILSGLRLGVTDRLFSRYLVSPKQISQTAISVDWVAGASMLVRYSLIENIGFMDENYFLYFEETDFCLQAKRAGWECWYVPSSRVIHYEGQSTGVVSGDSLRRRRPKYWFQSRQYYLIKNYGIIYTALADLSWGTMFTVHKFLDFIRLRFDNDPKYLWRDFWRNSIFLSWLDRKQDV